MARYPEGSGNTLVTGATDATPGPAPITVRKLNGAVINWAGGEASITTIPGITVYVTEQGVEEVEPLTGSEPPNGSTVTYGTYTYTLWDGQTESATYTRTVRLTGVTSLPSSGYVAGALADWAAEAGTTLSGSDVTAWVDSIGSKSAAPVGTPRRIASPGGSAGFLIAIETDEGFTCPDLTGFPASGADFSMMYVGRPTGVQAFYNLFGYGTSGNGTARTIAVDDTGQLCFDIGGSRVLIGVTPTNQMLVAHVVYEAGVMTFYLGLVAILSQAVTLATTLTRINFGRSFSNRTTTHEMGGARIYGRALTAAEVATNVAAANAKYIGDTTVTVPGTPTASNITQTGFTASLTAGENFGAIAWAVKAGTGTMTEAEILAGTGALAFGVSVLSNSTAWTRDVTGAAASTAYRVHVVFFDMVGGKSAVVSSGTITTSAATDVTAPVITNLAGDPTGTTTADLTVDVNEGGNGVWGVYLATATTPTRAQIRAGTDGDGAALLFTATTAPNAAATLTASAINLAENTGYQVAYQQDDGAGNQSAVAESAVFTTDAVPVGIPAQVDGLRTGSTNVGRINNSTALKTVTGDGLPSGWVNAGGCIYPTANGLTLDGYNLQDYRVFSNDKTGLTITNNLFGVTTSAGIPAGSQPRGSLAGSSVSNYMLHITPGSDDCTARYNDFKGYFGKNSSEAACIGKTFTSGGVCARRTQIDHNRFWDYEGDVFHDAGDTVFEWNWIGLPAQSDSDINPYSGTPGDYNSGDYVTTFIGAYQYVWLCTSSPATVAPPTSTNPGTNASWEKWSINGAHTDVVNPRAMLYDSTYQYNNFDVNVADTTTPFFNKRVGNVNNILRVVPNNPGPSYVGAMMVRGNRMARSPSQPSLTTQNANAPGEINWSFIDNRWGRRINGTFWSGSTTRIAAWTGNTDAISGATVAQP